MTESQIKGMMINNLNHLSKCILKYGEQLGEGKYYAKE